MGKILIARQVIEAAGGLAKTAQMNEAGISNFELADMCKNGFLTRVRHGYYQLSAQDIVSEEQMIATFFPEGVICLDSALFYYSYSDRTPLEWTIAVPRSIASSKLKIGLFPYRLIFTQKKYLKLGKTQADFNGIILPVYDKERTICDCFRYRTKIDSEMFNKAIHAYIEDKGKNIKNLIDYAYEMKLFKKINELIGVMLND